MKMILASCSPRRKELLKKISADFEVIPSTFDESTLDHSDPIKFAVTASREKAKEVSIEHPDALVIGADTVVTQDGRIMGKPEDMEDAKKMLELLSGRTHKVITGVTIFKSGRSLSANEITEVTFKKLSAKNIDAYLHSHEVLDKAGAYAIQEIGEKFVKKVKGDRDNVVGLPVKMLAQMIRLLP